jgi:tetratricopeptide (TPR) repeat protein
VLENRFRPILQKRLGLALGVWGEAGIGKSHSVRELLQTLPCQSLSLHATTPLATLAQTLPRPKKLALWANQNLTRLAKGEAVETASTLDSLGTTLAGLAPFVLHLEDIHEADQERLTFLQALAKMVLRIKGVALVVTSRREPPSPFVTFKLEPLSREDADGLLESELHSTLPQEALQWLYNKAAGNPLYSLEYLRYLTRQGFLWNDGKRWHWRKPLHDVMPVTVEALIEQLLEQAKTEDLQRYVLEAKALLPLETSDGVWQKVARVNEQELQTAIKELSRRGIFKENHFAHPLFREVTLKILSPERKRNLARRALKVLAHEPQEAVVFVDDADLEAEKALALLETIAATFEGAGKNLEASRCLEKAMKYAAGEARGNLALRAAHLSFKAGDARVLELAGQAVKILGETEETLKVLVQAHAMRGERSEVQALLPRLGHEVDKTWLTQQLFVVGAYDDLERLPATALKAEELSESSLYHIGYFLMDKGQLREALELVERCLQRPSLTTTGKALLQDIRASVFHYQGDYQQADVIFSEIIELYKEANTVWDGVVNTRRNRALNRLQMGLYREVLPDFLYALNFYSERGRSVLYAETSGMMGEVYLELGEYDKALDVLTESLSIFGHLQVQSYHVHLYSDLARWYVEHPTSYSRILAPKYVQSALSCAEELKSTLYEATAKLAASRVYRFTNQPSLALTYANEALQHAEAAGLAELSIEARTATALALSSSGERTEAKQQLQMALRGASERGMVFKVNKIGLELDRLNNDRESARQRMHWFEERGLLHGVTIAKHLFPELAGTKELPKQTTSGARLEVLGPIQITHGDTLSIRGRKRQELLALLLEARLSGRSEVSRLSLVDALYSNEDELKASSSLKNVVHGLRETYGESSIVTTANGYALGSLDSDAELFLQTHDTSLWRGLYLEGVDLFVESTVRDLLYTALFEKAKMLLEGDVKEPARVGGILTEAEPYNREYLKLYFTALRASKNHSKLARHYSDARERLLEVGETLPETWQGFLS